MRAPAPPSPHPTAANPTAATANPNAGSFGFVDAAAPPSTGVARGLFMPPRMTSAAGGLAPAPAVNPRAPVLQLPNAARAKKGKVSVKKNKAADGSGSSKPSRKKLAGRVRRLRRLPKRRRAHLFEIHFVFKMCQKCNIWQASAARARCILAPLLKLRVGAAF